MAAKSKRAPKTNVYWSKDPDNEDERIVKVHVPGVILEPNSNVKNPMVRKPIHMMKPRVVTLPTSLRNSLEKRRQELSRSDTNTSLSKDTTHSLLTYGEGSFAVNESHQRVKDSSKREVTLKELNPQDKKRVANLVKELAKVGEERQEAEERLKAERLAFEERLVILQEEYDAVIKEKIYLQKRFVELQALLVKYQTQGRTPSPRKAVKSPVSGDQPVQVSGMLSSVSPSKSVQVSPSKPTPVRVPGNTRPGLIGALSDKLDVSGLQSSLSQTGANGRTVTVNSGNTVGFMDTTLKPAPPYNNSLTLGDTVGETFPKILSSSQAEEAVLRTSGRTAPAATSSKIEVSLPQRQIVEIPQSSSHKEGVPHKSLEPAEPSANTASAVSTCHHPPTVVNSQPAMHPGVGVMSQAKSMFSVSEDGVPETRTDWKVSLRKNEDRSFSEASGVSGSFSAELDAVYRLYCREYELQLQLQQQQIELQKQQLQLQQQLQQVETLQQQQQQQQQQHQLQQQQQQQHPSTQCQQSINHLSSASRAMPGGTHEKHLTTVTDETPAPSPVPRPTSQPRQVSPARSLIPTPEGSSCVTTDGYKLAGVGVQQQGNMSTAGAYIIREDRSAGAEMSSDTDHRNVNNRIKLGKENKDPLVPDPTDRVLSAPPSLGHPRSNFKHRQVPRPHGESRTSADHSYRGRALVPGYERHPMEDNLHNSQQLMDVRGSTDYQVSRPSSSRKSIQSHGYDVSANRGMMTLRERHDQVFSAEQDVFSGRGSSDLFHPRSNYSIVSEQASLAAESFQTDSILSGTRTKPQLSFREPSTSYSEIHGALKRQTASSDQRFSLYSDIDRESRSRDHQMFLKGDDVMEQSVERSSLDNAYPLSLVDIVEDLEGKSRVQEHYLSSNPATAGGLDTTDSGYSQDTYKERSPLNSENVNSDDEEAAVLGDIFFLSGRI